MATRSERRKKAILKANDREFNELKVKNEELEEQVKELKFDVYQKDIIIEDLRQRLNQLTETESALRIALRGCREHADKALGYIL